MSLRDYQAQLDQANPLTGQSATFQTAGQPARGTIWFEPYAQPLQAEVNGEPVLVLQIGDRPGWSDVFKCIGRDGISATVRERDLRFTAIPAPVGAYLPLETTLNTMRSQRMPLTNQNQ